MYGWEMKKTHINDHGEKIATMQNVDSGETMEVPFNHANINPTS